MIVRVDPVFLTCLRPTADEAVAAFSAAGAASLELSLFSGPQHLDHADAAVSAAFAEALRSVGLKVFSVHACFGGAFDLSVLDQAARKAAVEAHMAQIRYSATLGAEAVIVHPGSSCPDATQRPQRRSAAAQSLTELASVADEVGIGLAVENMPPDYPGDNIEELVGLVDGLACDRAGFCFDTGHCHLCGIGQGEMIRAFAGRIQVIHWHDNHGKSDEHLIPGAGNIDWGDYFSSLAAAQFDAPVTVEAGERGMELSEFVRLSKVALQERRSLYV